MEYTHGEVGSDHLPQRPPSSIAGSQHWWTRLLDGDHVWGSLSVSPTRYGVARYSLVVFPPGIDRDERRLLRAWRAWPTWGATLWLLSLCLLSTPTAWAQFAVPTAVWLGVGAVLFARVAQLRTQVRTRCMTRFASHPDGQTEAEYAEMKVLVATLRSADTLRDQGQLSASGHEAIWWQVYDRLGAHRTANEHRCP
ncbi:MAG: hypothetical protein P4L86_19325 [Mycobacterium sp.]|nr:hypothetical protein [Mycobacterium sp.]